MAPFINGFNSNSQKLISIFFSRFFTGLDKVLAEHIAHLFIRDLLSLFSEKLELDNTVGVDHFEVSFYCNYYVSTLIFTLHYYTWTLSGLTHPLSLWNKFILFMTCEYGWKMFSFIFLKKIFAYQIRYGDNDTILVFFVDHPCVRRKWQSVS